MGKWVHRLSNIDTVEQMGDCANCGRVALKKHPNGWRCWISAGRWAPRKADFSYVKYKGPVCERCGFVPEDRCQLDVDHIDGNPMNSVRENLQTLCSNCHRLKLRRT